MDSEDQDSVSRFSDISLEEELLAIQKKEKKDLIAKTQKMKHGVPKGDKKKKKEVTAEISQLLADLDLKHDAELKAFLSSQASSQEIAEPPESSENGFKHDGNADLPEDITRHSETNDNTKSSARVSKAQKRRIKRAALEKERNKAIAEQELENLSGMRHLESEAIKKKLSERNLSIYEVPSDGNCLYKAVEHQLSISNLPLMTVQTLREKTSEYMLSHSEDYMPFLTCPETGDVLNEEMYEKYCDNIVKTPAWGGHIEIQVLSHIIGYPIEIIQAEGPNIIVGDEKRNPKLTLSYHRHVFGLGEHYNSVIPVAE